MAVLNDSETADLVWAALPISASASTWGDEIYFRTDLSAREQDAQEVVEMGAVAYDLETMIHPHPTLSETIGEVAGLAP